MRRDLKFQLVRLQDKLAVRVELAHEEIVIATGYCPFRRSFLPISDLIKLFNMNVPSYVIGDFNIKSIKLGDGYNNKFGSQFNILYKTGKVIHEGPHFPTFFGGRAGTTPDLILTNNKAFFNVHSAPGPDTSSDHSIVMVKIACGPIRMEIRERRCLRRADWENYKKDREGVTIEPLEGKETKEIDRAVEKVTESLRKAVERRIPKIKSRTLPHPEIDPETGSMMEEASKIKMLLSLNINYMDNRRRLTALREIIRERW